MLSPAEKSHRHENVLCLARLKKCGTSARNAPLSKNYTRDEPVSQICYQFEMKSYVHMYQTTVIPSIHNKFPWKVAHSVPNWVSFRPATSSCLMDRQFNLYPEKWHTWLVPLPCHLRHCHSRSKIIAALTNVVHRHWSHGGINWVL